MKKKKVLRGLSSWRAVFKIKQRTIDVTDGGKYIHVAITLSTSQRLSKNTISKLSIVQQDNSRLID